MVMARFRVSALVGHSPYRMLDSTPGPPFSVNPPGSLLAVVRSSPAWLGPAPFVCRIRVTASFFFSLASSGVDKRGSWHVLPRQRSYAFFKLPFSRPSRVGLFPVFRCFLVPFWNFFFNTAFLCCERQDPLPYPLSPPRAFFFFLSSTFSF